MEDSSIGGGGGATLAEISGITALPALSMVMGTLAVAVGGEPSERLQARLQHFSGGLLIGAVMTDIFPILRRHLVVHPDGVDVIAWWNVLAGIGGFATALFLMYGMRSLGLEELSAEGSAPSCGTEDAVGQPRACGDGEDSDDGSMASGWRFPPIFNLRAVASTVHGCREKMGRAGSPSLEPLLDSAAAQTLPQLPATEGAGELHKGLELAISRLTASSATLQQLAVAEEVDREAVDEEVHGLDFLLDMARRRCQSDIGEPLDARSAAKLRVHTAGLAAAVSKACILDRSDLPAMDAQLGSIAGRLRLLHASAEQRSLSFRRWGSKLQRGEGGMSPGSTSPIPSPRASQQGEVSQQLGASSATPTSLTVTNPLVPWGLVLAVLLDSTVDGMLIGLAGSVAVESGWLMAMATAIEMGFLGFSFACAAAGPAKAYGGILLCIVLLGLPPAAMMLASVAAASGASEVEDRPTFVGLIAFSLAAVLFLVVEELLLEAHESEGSDEWQTSIWLYFGLLLSIVLDVAA